MRQLSSYCERTEAKRESDTRSKCTTTLIPEFRPQKNVPIIQGFCCCSLSALVDPWPQWPASLAREFFCVPFYRNQYLSSTTLQAADTVQSCVLQSWLRRQGAQGVRRPKPTRCAEAQGPSVSARCAEVRLCEVRLC